MRRVTRLLEEGTEPGRILVATFTRTAARDLQDEIKGLGVDGVEKVKAGTLHSFCFGLLGREEVLTQTQRAPRPLLAFEETYLINDMAGGKFGGVNDCKKRIRAFNADWARLQSDHPGWPTDPVDKAFHLELIDWLRFHGGMLVGEIVPLTLEYLRDNPLSSGLGSFDHVIVDEYQDLNRAEQVLLDLIAEGGSFAVVGDEDQSIYSFKHAHPEGISEFAETHDETCDSSLGECRRCPRLVVGMANSLISNNRHRVQRSLDPMPGSPDGEVHVVQWSSLQTEASGIASFINSRIQAGDVEPGKVLVLAPRRQIGYGIRDALNQVGSPAHSFFNEEALDGDPKKKIGWEAQEAYALLTLLADPDDDVALRCWCGFGSANLRRNEWARLRGYCGEQGLLTVREALEKLSDGEDSIPYTSGVVRRFKKLRDRLGQLEGLSGQPLFDMIFPPDVEWSEPVRLIVKVIDDETNAPDLREAVRIAVSQPELPLDVDYVRVMSLHKSKGLTADLVVVAGCIQGLVPHQFRGGSEMEIQRSAEEQRRLFYVALTRTRNTIVLSSTRSLPRDLAHRMGAITGAGTSTTTRAIASSFLRELGPSKPIAVDGAKFLASQGIDCE